MNKPIHELPMVEPTSFRPRSRARSDDEMLSPETAHHEEGQQPVHQLPPQLPHQSQIVPPPVTGVDPSMKPNSLPGQYGSLGGDLSGGGGIPGITPAPLPAQQHNSAAPPLPNPPTAQLPQQSFSSQMPTQAAPPQPAPTQFAQQPPLPHSLGGQAAAPEAPLGGMPSLDGQQSRTGDAIAELESLLANLGASDSGRGEQHGDMTAQHAAASHGLHAAQPPAPTPAAPAPAPGSVSPSQQFGSFDPTSSSQSPFAQFGQPEGRAADNPFAEQRLADPSAQPLAAPQHGAPSQAAPQQGYDATPPAYDVAPAYDSFGSPAGGVSGGLGVQQFAAPVSSAAPAAVPTPSVVDPYEFGMPAGADHDLISALRLVLPLRASDLHLTAKAPPMLRVDGGLRPAQDDMEPWDAEKVERALFSLTTPEQRAIFEETLELDFAYTVSEEERFRVNFYMQRGAVGAAFRLIPTKIKKLAELGVPDAVSRFATLARGLVLVTGPTGSGKSTTLAALIDLVNRTRADHIVTVEDPIEFMHQNQRSVVNQREVGHDTHSFANALKHVLRQDPDVILIGELRDLETISVALTAAETGHLVFATLHTQDAGQTIDRVIDVFPPHQQGQVRSQLAATLQGVVCQTLVKLASGQGRVVATEVLVATPAIGNLIREGKTYQIPSALQAGRDLGMYTMDQHLAELVDAGRITHAAAMEKAHDPEGLKSMIHRSDPNAGMSTTMGDSDFDFNASFGSAGSQR